MHPRDLAIRPECPADLPAVRNVNERAFGQKAEADLVDTLRNAGKATISFVAVHQGQIVGHILFNPV